MSTYHTYLIAPPHTVMCYRISSPLRRATIRVCAGNYLEHLIHRTVGLEYVCPFLSLAAGLNFL